MSNELRETMAFNALKGFVMIWQGPKCTFFNCELSSLNQMR